MAVFQVIAVFAVFHSGGMMAVFLVLPIVIRLFQLIRIYSC